MSRMSRVFAGAVVAVVAGAALAGPIFAADATVSFAGSSPLGLPLLSCASSPNRGSISITTDDTLNVENQTGHTAAVYINGNKTAHQVGDGQGVPITFPAGTWSVALAPTCLLNLNDASTVSVDVVEPARAAEPVPTPTPTPTPTHTTKPAPTHTTKPTKAPTRSAKPAPRTATSPSPTAKPAPVVTPSTSTSTAVVPGASGASGAGGGTSGTGSAIGGTNGMAGAAGSSGTQKTGPQHSSTNAAAGSDQVNIGAAQAIPASDSSPATPNYLLAVIALIGILGVGSATVRALNNQRQARRAAY